MRRRQRVHAAIGLLLLVGLACLACGDDEAPPPSEPAARTPASSHERDPAIEPAAARRTERPLPAFSGRTLDGQPLDVVGYIGRRLMIAFVNPEEPAGEDALRALARIAPLRGKHNFEIIGVAVGSSSDAAREARDRVGADFPILDDARGQITRRFGLRGPVTLVGVDPEGYMVFASTGVSARGEDAVRALESELRENLRLPPADHDRRAPGLLPQAPDFTARYLEGGTFSLAEQRGKALVLLFFLHTCPHCHDVLNFLKEEFARLPEDSRPLFVGLELTGRTASVRARLAEDGLDFFPVLFDDSMASVQKAYGVFAGVPDMVMIDAEGQIVDRVQGWSPGTDAPLVRMRLARLGGAPVPMLLSEHGYSGSEVCGVCHEREYQTWQLTSHASAFDTLVTHGADSDAECVGCHVVGFGAAQGFKIAPRTPWLEDVGCESCHGRGGPHRSPDFMETTGYEQACLQCHDTKHSLGFEFATFMPRISHAANAAILALPPEERERALAERGAVRQSLLPTQAAYVGSEICQSCHAVEHERWLAGPHAGALQSLSSQGKEGDAQCLRCHTTALGSEGGFPAGAAVSDHPDLARVGCESCHGPGGDHVAEDATKLGSIISLGDKCDSCVILQICGSCHDDANDPGFEFEVQEKIDRIRHGTIEAGTGKPLARPGEKSAGARTEAATLFAWLDRHATTPGPLEIQP